TQLVGLRSHCSSPVTTPHSPSSRENPTSGGEMKGGDVEAGTAAPYPGTTESPELRWALIRKIYVVLCLQLLLT
uniref:Uncharacterized protein n=1 Tax=Aegilops tauschii subsp. strangulata TaxID=200361 RepID=A0A453GLB3_AEGTS